jgi:hypothetical protein
MSKSFDATTKTFRDYTAEEQADYDARMKIYNDNIVPKKLEAVRKLRLQKLMETDFYALQDVTMSNEMKTWRQSLRDITTNHTNEEAYDLLLARDENGNLTHSIWSKP